MKTSVAKICYVGIYKPSAPRDRVYLEGLKKRGIEITECVDGSAGFLKFFRLAKKLYALKNQYDILWVGYLSTMVAPLAYLITGRKIIFNALDSWYDRSILDRGMYGRFSPKAVLIWFCDFLAFHLSHIVLLESEQQKIFIAKRFFVATSKLHVVFTGADETIFHPDPNVAKARDFTVVFRGLFLPATGVEYVIEAARILKEENIRFRIIGWGDPIQTKIKKMISDYKLSNVDLTGVFLEPDELRSTLLSAHVMLGQFADHPRMGRTIQNKTVEALALGMPYITRDSLSNRELLDNGTNCLFVGASDPQDIANKILYLRQYPNKADLLGRGARKTYDERLTPDVLVQSVYTVLSNI